MDPATITKRLQEGYYKTKLPWPPFRGAPLKDTRTDEDKAMIEAARADERRLNDLFRKDAIEALGFVGHPKADKLWAKAWDLGHGSGHHEVWLYLQDLAELAA